MQIKNIFTGKQRKKIILMLLVSIIVVSFSSCKKYLEEKSDLSLTIPKTLEDCQRLLNNYLDMTQQGSRIAETASDNFTVSWANYQGYTVFDRQWYEWNGNAYPLVGEWQNRYAAVAISNTILQLLGRITPADPGEQSNWNRIKGSALFFRAFHFYSLAQDFSLTYDPLTADNDLGIALRLTADVSVPSKRASVKETYDQIIKDISDAIPLLPDLPIHSSQPSKAAAYAMLSRVYLSMNNFPLALSNASNSLTIKSNLLDFNIVPPLNTSSGNVFPSDFTHPEISFFHTASPLPLIYYYGRGTVDPVLYNSYSTDDLRRDLFFTSDAGVGGPQLYGSYSGNAYWIFDGLATDEVYLNRAECYARSNQLNLAMADLNTVLAYRYKTGTFTPYNAANFNQVTATQLILQERRKELIFRGLRWTDIRRLNKENDPIYKVGTLTRTFAGNPSLTFTLPSNDLRYAFLIPLDVIKLSGMPQNPR